MINYLEEFFKALGDTVIREKYNIVKYIKNDIFHKSVTLHFNDSTSIVVDHSTIDNMGINHNIFGEFVLQKIVSLHKANVE